MTTIAFTSEHAFTNAEAQDFAFELKTRGPQLIDEVVNRKGRYSAAHINRVLAAGETIAAAIGHPPAEQMGCALVDEWLLENQYVPDPATLDTCAEQIDNIRGKTETVAKLGIPAEELGNLVARLRRPPGKSKRKPPKPNRKDFRSLVHWLNTSTGEADPGTRFDRQGNATVYLYYVTVNAACKLVNYRKVQGLELPLNESNEPRELAAALRILLRGWRNSLQYLLIDDIPDATCARNRPKYKVLAKCAAELADLPALEKFAAKRVFFDDNVLSSVCRNDRLTSIQINNGEVSRQAIEILQRCRNLNRISISRCPEFPYEYQDELAARCPNAKFVAVGRK